ncbi:hypothetical protein M5K25_026309 [Dendrobium thyrsiflorum]|uniref:Uncharacterized protein n=1 Tax=Dendrobium thyrsiflorum TaxID=117978 RepID=A0ABD0TX45_DENTH
MAEGSASQASSTEGEVGGRLGPQAHLRVKKDSKFSAFTGRVKKNSRKLRKSHASLKLDFFKSIERV